MASELTGQAPAHLSASLCDISAHLAGCSTLSCLFPPCLPLALDPLKEQRRPQQVCKEKCKKLTAPGIPRRSPIQVLTRPDPAWLPRSDEIGRVQGGMAVSKDCRRRQALYTVNGKRGSGMWCITPQIKGISRGRFCSGSQLRPYRFSAFWLRSSVVSVLISLISDTSPIWGLHIKRIFGPGS